MHGPAEGGLDRHQAGAHPPHLLARPLRGVLVTVLRLAVGGGVLRRPQMASPLSPSRRKQQGKALRGQALKARNALVLEHLPLADAIASVTARRLFPLVEREDLIQVAREALVRSAPRCRAGEPAEPYLRRCNNGTLQHDLLDRARIQRPICSISTWSWLSWRRRARPSLGHGIPTQDPHHSPNPQLLLKTGKQLRPMAYLSIPTDSPAGSFAVFFDGPGAFGIHPVNAIDAEHAVEIASAFYPGSRLVAVPSGELEGCNNHKVLAAWLLTTGESQQDQ